MVKLIWLKSFEGSIIGTIFETGIKSANNFVSEGYAEYVTKKNDTKLIKNRDKENNNIYSEVCVTGVTGVTGVTSVTGVTGNTDNTDNTTCNTCNTVTCTPKEIFSDNLLDIILKHFYLTKNTPVTFAELSEKISRKKETIRGTINRVKELFHVTGSKGRTNMLQVGEKGIDEIERRINTIELRKEQKKEELLQRKINDEKNENLRNDIFTFIRLHKPKIINGNLLLDFDELIEYSPELSDYFLLKSEEFLNIFKSDYSDGISVDILNLPHESILNIEEIRKEQLNKIICVEGRVTSFGEVKPLITKIKYECPSCGTLLVIAQNYRTGEIKEAIRCSCGRRGGFSIAEREEVNSCFIQLEDLQDKTDNPHSQRIKAVLFNGLTKFENIKKFNPGNEIRCVGILKEVPIFKNKKKTVFLNWILEVVSAELIEKEVNISNFSNDDINKIKELSNDIDKNGFNPLIESFAPDVYGYDEIKSAISLQLCNRRNNKKTDTVRNKSNILLIGDPGVAKSVLGDFAVDITPGARKAVGGGSSAVGITASVVKEEDSLGGYKVEPGAIVLARDLLFLDEFNNLSDDDKPKLQEGMNEQRVSINKANIHVSMKVTCGLLAVANPKNGHFVEIDGRILSEQFNIPSPILNRFDSVFVVRDIISEDSDMKIAEKMIRRHNKKLKPKYDKQFLRKFFSYVKLSNEPIIGEEAEQKLKNVYTKVRKIKNNGVKVNPRFLESLTRMSISCAKLRLSEYVKDKDVERSLKILSKSQYSLGVNLNGF